MILSLTGYTPPARYDDLPWTSARLEESTTETGSYTLLEEFDLDPVDTDPAFPATRSFTTENATAGNWYRIVWVDEDADQSEPTSPVQSLDGVQAFATRSELATILRVDPTANADALDRVLLAAAGEIVAFCGRSDFAGWELAIATQVNINRATEMWAQAKVQFGIIGLGGEVPMHVGTYSWLRHANDLWPIRSGSAVGLA